MQTQDEDSDRRSLYLFAGAAAIIVLFLFFAVSWLHDTPVVMGRQAPGMVAVRITAADTGQVCAGCAQPMAAERAAKPLKIPAAGKISRPKEAVNVTPDQGDNGPSLSAEERTRYEDLLFNHIAKYIRYPRSALRVCPSGATFLRFQSSREGYLLSVVVEQSSGCTIIDDEAVETLRRAQPLPPIPGGLPERITVHMPLSFGKS